MESCPGGDSAETGAAGLGCVQTGIWQRTWGQLQEGGFVQGQVGLGLCDTLCFQAGKGDGLGRGFPVGSRHLLLRERERADSGTKKCVCEKQNKAGASSERGFVSSASLGPLKQKRSRFTRTATRDEGNDRKRTCPKMCN